MFANAREKTGLYKYLPPQRTPPTFHEIRSLADKLAKDAGYDLSVIQGAMAHENEQTTKSYLDEHQMPYQSVDMVFTKAKIGGEFTPPE